MESDFSTPEGIIVGVLSVAFVLISVTAIATTPVIFIVSVVKYFRTKEGGWLAALVATGMPTLAAVLLLATGIFGYATDYGPIVDQWNETDTTDERIISLTKAGIEASMPDDWDYMADLNEGAILQVGSAVDDVYAIVFEVRKDDLVEGTELIHTQDSANIDILDVLYNADLTENEAVEINGADAYHARLTGDLDGLRFVYYNVMVEGAESFFQIMTWTTPSREAENKEAMLKFIESFSLKEYRETI